jgi:hypothetical protein
VGGYFAGGHYCRGDIPQLAVVPLGRRAEQQVRALVVDVVSGHENTDRDGEVPVRADGRLRIRNSGLQRHDPQIALGSDPDDVRTGAGNELGSQVSDPAASHGGIVRVSDIGRQSGQSNCAVVYFADRHGWFFQCIITDNPVP